MPTTPRAYLDHNAGSPIRPEALDAMLAALREAGNASSIHAEGRRGRAIIETARARVAALVGADPDRVVFTSGGTEADNLAIAGLGRGRLVLAGATEHAAILESGHRGTAVPVDADGRVRLEKLDEMLREASEPMLVVLQAANNETGIVQPIGEAASLAASYGARLHCDAVQAAGRIPLTARDSGGASLALSSHKLGGPGGVGALILAEGVELDGRLVAGGGQERGRRGGTENLAGIAGFGVAAELAARHLTADAARLGGLRDTFEAGLRAIVPDLVVFGAAAPRLPNTSAFAIPRLKAETALIALDLDGVAVSSGAACSSGKVGRSHVLAAMGVPDELARCAIRVSLGWSSTRADVTRALAAFETLVRRLYGTRAESVAA